jgi:hypothetical protein
MVRTASIQTRGLADPMPAESATEWIEYAETLLDLRQLEQARIAFDRAEAAGANSDRCSSGRWHAAMLAGNFESAWRESDAIRARGAPDPNRFWNGEPLLGAHVIVRCLHGYGDAVQMLRYAPLLQRIAVDVVFEVPPRLLPLAPLFRGVRKVISWDRHTPRTSPRWDVQVEVTELPYIFRTTTSDLPIATRYIKLPGRCIYEAAAVMARSVRSGLSGRPRIGYVWAAGEWNPERSVPFEIFEPLLQTEFVEHWSLQGGPAAADAKGWIASGKMRDATAVCGDGLVALAAAIANLDLVITVDTLAAHLAGALGKPAWVLLQHAADWRWLTDRSDSPWYPEMRLFRQPAAGNWRDIVGEVMDAFECGVSKRIA